MSPSYVQIAAVRELTLSPVTYPYATADMARQRRELLWHTSAERRRRHLRTVLEVAIDQCERRDLAAPNRLTAAPPEQVVALIEQLQLVLHQQIHPPLTNRDALDMLFGLQRAFMP